MLSVTLEDLQCACCAEAVEAAALALPGVTHAEIDLGRQTLTVTGSVDEEG